MAVDALLPPPGASPREVLFRRLLLQSSRLVAKQQQQAQQLPQPEGLEGWRKDPKLHAQVQLLKERLFDLEKSKDSPSSDVLAAYWVEVNAVAAELRPQDTPAYCRNLAVSDAFGRPGQPGSSGQGLPGASAGTSAGPSAAHPSLGPGHTGSSTSGSSPARPSGLPHSSPGPAAAAAAARTGTGSGTSDPSTSSSSRQGVTHWSDEAKKRIETQRALQSELGEELLGMTAQLKAGAEAMQSAIRHRGKLLDATEVALVNSTANAQQVAAGAKRQYQASRLGLCQTCLLLVGLGAVLVFMVLFIRLTSVVGLGKR